MHRVGFVLRPCGGPVVQIAREKPMNNRWRRIAAISPMPMVWMSLCFLSLIGILASFVGQGSIRIISDPSIYVAVDNLSVVLLFGGEEWSWKWGPFWTQSDGLSRHWLYWLKPVSFVSVPDLDFYGVSLGPSGGILLAVVFGWLFARNRLLLARRRVERKCPSCGYPLGGGGVCAECGRGHSA